MKVVKIIFPVIAAILALTAFNIAMAEEADYCKAEEGFKYNPPDQPAESGSRGTYDAWVKIYIVEPECTRWEYSDETPYHMGFLDFAYDEYVSLQQYETLNESIVWDPAAAGYPDVRPDNILAIAVVFSDIPQQAYGDPPSGNPYTAYFVEACAAADPVNSWPHQSSDGFTHNVFMEEATATW